MSAKFIKGDRVMVITGKNKGRMGTITKVLPKKQKLIVSGVHTVKRHLKPSENQEGGIVTKDLPIWSSNVSHMDSKNKPTRVGFRMEEGKKVRYAKTTNEIIGK